MVQISNVFFHVNNSFLAPPLGYSHVLGGLLLAPRSTKLVFHFDPQGQVTQLPCPPSSFHLDSATGGIDQRSEGRRREELVCSFPSLLPCGSPRLGARPQALASCPSSLQAQGGNLPAITGPQCLTIPWFPSRPCE